MYELNKARLTGIGPRGARYSDVLLDLSGAGDPVSTSTLTDAPVHRPAPYSLLMLENGGGKSVLLKLLFSVVLPGRKKTLGGATLEDFVLDTDTGHVALEWMNTKTGQRLVTGKVYQRRPRSTSNTNPLAEAWYSFQPTDDLTIETLPVADTGRRRRLDGYREALEAASRDTPAAQLAWLGDDQGRWRTHLRDHGIEPDLFEIQRRMNGDEGDAAAITQFTSSKDFVDWLLKTVTDPADYTALADTFEAYATTLAARESLLLEKDFLEGAVVGLEAVADAHDQLGTARSEARTALRRSADLLASLNARHAHEASEVERLEGEFGTKADIERLRLAERDRTRDVANETKRQTITLRLAGAKKELAEAERAQVAANDVVEAWAVVPTVAEHQRRAAVARELADAVKAADEHGRPALERRDAAAGDLLAALDAAAAQRTQAAKAHAKTAQERTLQLTALGQERSARQAAKGRDEQAVIDIGERVTNALDAIAAAVGRDVIAAGTAPEDVAQAREAAQKRHEQAKGVLTGAETALRTQQDEHKTAQEAADRAAAKIPQAARELTDAQAAQSTMMTEAARLATNAVIAATAGDEERELTATELDHNHHELLTQLDAQRASAQKDVNQRARQLEEDQRVLDALGNGGLLPPRPEVSAALTVLHAAGVHAHPGWRYLTETTASDQRLDLVRRHPHLADGVVLVNAAQLDTARQALEAANLLPAAAVTVSAGASLLADVDDPDFYTLEPTPAMYDLEAAEERRAQLDDAMAHRTAELDKASQQLGAITEARADLVGWRRAYPAGAPDRLAAAVAAATEAHAKTVTDAEELAATAAQLQDVVTDGQQALERAQTAERAAHDTVVDLTALESVVAPALGAASRLETLRAQIEAHARFLDDAEQRAGKLEFERDQANKAAEDATRAASEFTAEATKVVSTDGSRADHVPDKPLTILRHELDEAERIYQQQATSQELRDAHEKASAAVAEVVSLLAMRPAPAVAQAQELLNAAGSNDPATWDTHLNRARDELTRVTGAVGTLNQRVGTLDHELATNTPGDRRVWIVLPEALTPTSVEHGDQLLADATQAQAVAQREYEAAVRATGSARQLREDARRDEGDFRSARDRLQAFLRQHDIPTPEAAPRFDGNAHTADSDITSAIDTVVAKTKAADTASARFDRDVTELRELVGRSSYDQLTNATRRAVLDTPVAMLGSRAREWAAAMEARQISLATDLGKASEHRANITRRLSSLATDALTTLRNAQRLSRLPESLGDWSGKEFLHIRYSHPDAQTVAVRVGDVVDAVSQRIANAPASGKGSGTKFSGLALVLEAVHACVPKGFSVDVLKPDSVLRDERVAVEDLNDVLSGGQALTAGIVLYCTLAALKGNQRGQMKTRHSGVLFLDNPIGKASAAYLLDVQQGMADALGVQLIYTTGLYDDRVLASFPLWVRLRNDADLRAGLKHISVSQRVAANLPHPYDDDANDAAMPGTVTATRVHRRPQPVA